MTPLAFQIFSSPIGEVLVAGRSYAVTYVTAGDDRHQLAADFKLQHEGASPVDTSGYIREACGIISDYLNGRTRQIALAVQLEGSDFQRKVWHEIRQIPFGRTTTYSAIAANIGAPESFRAVANACGKNPVPLIIPCHRVLHKNGDVSGFSMGGEKVKRFLLNLEKKSEAVTAGTMALT